MIFLQIVTTHKNQNTGCMLATWIMHTHKGMRIHLQAAFEGKFNRARVSCFKGEKRNKTPITL